MKMSAPEIHLYNSLTRTKEIFAPIDTANVRMYVCGPTVYDFAHIGNARPVIVFDVLFRFLRYVYGAGHVTYARNITDVDDKINARAARDFPDLPLNDAIAKVTAETTAQFHDDIVKLGVLEPTVEPRATDHIDDMRLLIEKLVDSGHAYVAADHVLFDVSTLSDYGRLAKRSLEEMEAGARVDVAPYKKGAMDFVLWKPSNAEEPAWRSPVGISKPGRPGWHIECSAMAEKHLGRVFDIHGGGVDLIFPHHENEIAQSRCAHGTGAMAQIWMHNGFLQVEGQKMSKSLGNFTTINQLLGSWPGEVLRLNMLRTHYRQPINWTVRGLEESWRILDRWYAAIGNDPGEVVGPEEVVVTALADDLNTPQAIAELHGLASGASGNAAKLKASAHLIGLLDRTNADWLAATQPASTVSYDQVERLVQERLVARRAKNWTESDRIRDELVAKGVRLSDSIDAETKQLTTTWEVVRQAGSSKS
ncbi:MAG: cysteine--tRNA ligase [Hyphomicrobiaceae bacterium]